MISLRQRSSEPELMDDLDCHGPVVEQTLRELDIINRLLGGNDVTLDGIERLLEGRSGNTKFVVADVGCGSGDMAKRMIKWSRTKGLDLAVTGFDANPHIVSFAKKNCEPVEKVSFEVMDVLSDQFAARKFDVMTATLFMHHFNQQQLEVLVRSMSRQSRIGFVINDIHRHFLAYHAIRTLTRLFSRSPMVKFDAPLSVRRAFKRKELEQILEGAGISTYTIKWKWAFRWQVIVEN